MIVRNPVLTVDQRSRALVWLAPTLNRRGHCTQRSERPRLTTMHAFRRAHRGNLRRSGRFGSSTCDLRQIRHLMVFRHHPESARLRVMDPLQVQNVPYIHVLEKEHFSATTTCLLCSCSSRHCHHLPYPLQTQVASSFPHQQLYHPLV